MNDFTKELIAFGGGVPIGFLIGAILIIYIGNRWWQ